MPEFAGGSSVHRGPASSLNLCTADLSFNGSREIGTVMARLSVAGWSSPPYVIERTTKGDEALGGTKGFRYATTSSELEEIFHRLTELTDEVGHFVLNESPVI